MHVNSLAWKLFGGSNQKFRGSIDAAQPEELKVANIFYTAKTHGSADLSKNICSSDHIPVNGIMANILSILLSRPDSRSLN